MVRMMIQRIAAMVRMVMMMIMTNEKMIFLNRMLRFMCNDVFNNNAYRLYLFSIFNFCAPDENELTLF